jgi:hypothetical protein
MHSASRSLKVPKSEERLRTTDFATRTLSWLNQGTLWSDLFPVAAFSVIDLNQFSLLPAVPNLDILVAIDYRFLEEL